MNVLYVIKDLDRDHLILDIYGMCVDISFTNCTIRINHRMNHKNNVQNKIFSSQTHKQNEKKMQHQPMVTIKTGQ